jgi:hypothetical protein
MTNGPSEREMSFPLFFVFQPDGIMPTIYPHVER